MLCSCFCWIWRRTWQPRPGLLWQCLKNQFSHRLMSTALIRTLSADNCIHMLRFTTQICVASSTGHIGYSTFAFFTRQFVLKLLIQLWCHSSFSFTDSPISGNMHRNMTASLILKPWRRVHCYSNAALYRECRSRRNIPGVQFLLLLQRAWILSSHFPVLWTGGYAQSFVCAHMWACTP